MPFYTPLRYPGGKRRLVPTVIRLLEANGLRDINYAETYAGGAAVPLALLMEEYASTVHINDLSRAVFAFWHCVLHENTELCKKIEKTKVTMDEWHRQRDLYSSRATANIFDLGFATLFLNRTNRSGILSGGVIGGKQQTGNWGLDARFGKEELIHRLRRIGRYASRIHLYNHDAEKFISSVVSQLPNSFSFFDPPYIENGADLYLNEYDVPGHLRLASAIESLRSPWITTYDHSAIKHGLFKQKRRVVYGLNYSAQARYEGKEVMFLSDDLIVPADWKKATRIRMSPHTSDSPLFGMIDSIRIQPRAAF